MMRKTFDCRSLRLLVNTHRVVGSRRCGAGLERHAVHRGRDRRVEAQSGRPDARDGHDERFDLRRLSGGQSHAPTVQGQYARPRRLGGRRRLAGRLSGPQRHVSRNASDVGQYALPRGLAPLPTDRRKLRASISGISLRSNTSTPTRTTAGICPTRIRRPLDLAIGARTRWSPPTIQKGWGSDWGSVNPWAMPDPDYFDSTTPFDIADMNTQRYTDAFNEVKAYGARNSAVRTPHQTATGLFWAYDRPGTGAPPVLFIENMVDIGNASRQYACRQRSDVRHGVGDAGGLDHRGLGHQVRGRSLAAHHGHPRGGERRQPEHDRRSRLGISGCAWQQSRHCDGRFHAAVSRLRLRPRHDGRGHLQVVGIVLRHE